MKRYYVRVNGVSYDVEIEEMGTSRSAPQMVQSRRTSSAENETYRDNRASRVEESSGDSTKVNSPMPGTVLKLNVQVGSSVSKGQVLLILEAMKMENEIVSSMDGVVTSISANKGASVNAGDILLTIEKK